MYQSVIKLSSGKIYTIFGLLFTLLLAGCADQTVKVAQPVAWGTANRVVQVGSVFIAGQPDLAGLEAARAAGVEHIINLRMPEEMTWDEEAAVNDLGMQYLSVPISGEGPGFDVAAIQRLHQWMDEHPGQKALVHCASGNRVSAWYGLYLVEREGYRLEEAIPIAEQAGLKPALVDNMREYLGTR